MSVLFYKRPDYIQKPTGPLDLSSCQKNAERAACSKAAIPDNLSFENIIEGRTLPPMALRDFMEYLVYVAHDAENLQFYLWLSDYTKRFHAISARERMLSPIWSADQSLHPIKGPAVANPSEKTSTKLELNDMGAFYVDESTSPTSKSSRRTSIKEIELSVEDSRDRGDVGLEDAAAQPFREEIRNVIAHYITAGSPRELNLSHRDRELVKDTLKHTTHPSTFDPILAMVSLTLKNQSHPNFVRWSMCNGNQPRVIALRSLAAWVTFSGCLMAILLVLSGQSRYWRIWLLPVWYFAFANMIASYKGLCVLLYRRHVREIRPWELEDKDTTLLEDAQPQATTPIGTRFSPALGTMLKPKGGAHDSIISFSSHDPESAAPSFTTERLSPFGPNNTYMHEPWVTRWARRPFLQKIWLKKLRIQEEGLRLMQNRIVVQAELWSLIITVPLVVAVVALPKGNFY